MWREFKTIKYLEALRRQRVNKAFLAKLRTDLATYMEANPLSEEAVQMNRSWSWNIAHILSGYRLAPALAMFLLLLLGSTSIAFASQGSLPGEPLYPVKMLSENVRSVLAVSPQARESLEIRFAAQRVEEIKTLVSRQNTDPQTLNVALSRLGSHMNQASRIIEREKDKGKDVQNLVAAAESGFANQQSDLEKAFNFQRTELRTQLKEVQDKIAEAKKTGSSTEVNALSEQITSLKNARKNINTARNEAAKTIAQQRDNIAKAMKAQQAAQAAINDAKNASENLADEITKNNLSLPSDIFNRYNTLIAQAADAYNKGDFTGARQLAKDALNGLEGARQAVDQALEQVDTNQNPPTIQPESDDDELDNERERRKSPSQEEPDRKDNEFSQDNEHRNDD